MTHITMCVAVWNHWLGLMPAEDDVPWFSDIRLDVLHDDGCLLFVPSEGGTPLHYKENPKSRGKPPSHVYEFGLDRAGCGLADLPRFALHEVDMSVDDAGNMVWDMPPTHELPWPVHVGGMSHDDRATVAEQELTLRVGSAAGDCVVLCRVAMDVPDWARRVLGCGVWSNIFWRARNAT